ncbi:unnamed protein product [Eruca vesicaria subsp. sativa]|uniref:Uncharacterized protein n=1 Tax=Eruca vesicaria subsp. sativa TaxID=29727 RepID=A0ABC8JNG1_ERUVS|nr:unnamed protein product [Eruca vesicaria subsp. sativa]
MRRFLQRFPSLVTRNLLHSPTINPHVTVPSLNRVTSRFVFFSSESRGSGSNEVVSKEELKKRIQSFLDDGDEDALPDLFEAMMTRKLSGNHDESDDEVMEEVRKYPINDAHKVDDSVESGDGDSSDSDVESDGPEGDGDSSDSDAESDGDSPDSDIRDGDSSDSDIEIDGLKDVDLSGLSVKINGLKDGDLSGLNVKINGLKPDHSSYSDSESD